MAGNWIIYIISLVVIILYSQVWSRKSKISMIFPVLLTILTGWIFPLIETLAKIIPQVNPANLTNGVELIRTAPWFSIRYTIPFKWGFPKFNAITLAGYLGSMVKSIGDYYSYARMSEAPAPTAKIILRTKIW